MKRNAVKGSCALERFEAWKADEIIARSVISLAMAFADGCARRRKEFVYRCVAFIRVASLDRTLRRNMCGQAFALINVENGVGFHYRNDFGITLAAVLIDDLQPLHKEN